MSAVDGETTMTGAELDVSALSRRRSTVAGFTLLEVLIALLVLSLGLLGLAALQAATVDFNHQAYLRSQATSLAYDMADRMRANREAALNGAYDAELADPAPACGGGGGGGGSVAAGDIAAWRNALACVLPAGNGSVDVDGGIVTVLVTWDESRGERDAQEFSMATGL